jgi:PAS domain S-box-containing protein
LDIIGVNESAIKHYGYSREEFLKLNARDLRPEEDVPYFLQEVSKMKSGINNTRTWRHKKKDGTVINVEIFSHEIVYEGRRVWLGLSNDITEKVRAEAMVKKSLDDIRQLTEHIQKVREEERAHIAREIHDELGQQLTVLKMDVSWLNKKLQSDPAVADRLNELTTMLDGTVKTVRRISSELRPSLLDDLGLVATMDWHLKEFGKRTGIETFFDEPDSIHISNNITTGLYRIFQESLTNVARHAEASKVYVSLTQTADELLLKVQDNGKGFDKEKVANKRTLGILGMKERAEMMGGNYSISSELGKGTTVVISISQPGANGN